MSPLLEGPVQVAVVDYGMGNRRSVEKALLHVGRLNTGLLQTLRAVGDQSFEIDCLA